MRPQFNDHGSPSAVSISRARPRSRALLVTTLAFLLPLAACRDAEPEAPFEGCHIIVTLLPTAAYLHPGDSAAFRAIPNGTCNIPLRAVNWTISDTAIARFAVQTDSTASLVAQKVGSAVLVAALRADTNAKGLTLVDVRAPTP